MKKPCDGCEVLYTKKALKHIPLGAENSVKEGNFCSTCTLRLKNFKKPALPKREKLQPLNPKLERRIKVLLAKNGLTYTTLGEKISMSPQTLYIVLRRPYRGGKLWELLWESFGLDRREPLDRRKRK